MNDNNFTPEELLNQARGEIDTPGHPDYGKSIYTFTDDQLTEYVNAKIEERNKFSISFADWLDKLEPSQRTSVWSKNGEYRGLFTMDNEQLLEKYIDHRTKQNMEK